MFSSLARIAFAFERLADLYAQDLASRSVIVRERPQVLNYGLSNPTRKPRVYHLEEEPEPVWPAQSPK